MATLLYAGPGLAEGTAIRLQVSGAAGTEWTGVIGDSAHLN